MIRTLYLRWHLAADEAYLRILQREGWPDESLAALRKSCQAIRVELATARPLPDPDRVVMAACGIAAASLGVLMLWPSLAKIAS